MMPDKDKEIIINKAIFLQEKGYMLKIEDCCIVYENSKLKFLVAYERYSDFSDIDVLFLDINMAFSVGWIAFVRKGIKTNPRERLNNVLVLLDYIQDNYEDITNRFYCEDSERLIDEYIEKNTSK